MWQKRLKRFTDTALFRRINHDHTSHCKTASISRYFKTFSGGPFIRLPRKETPTYENITSLTFGTHQYHGTILMAQTVLKHFAFKAFNKEIEKLLKKSIRLSIIYNLNENLILWHSYNLSFQIFTANFFFFSVLKVKKDHNCIIA